MAISQRARPYQAPATRPAATTASATAKYTLAGTRAPATSISATIPTPNSASDSTRRPSGERGLAATGGGGGGGGGSGGGSGGCAGPGTGPGGGMVCISILPYPRRDSAGLIHPRRFLP